MSESELPTPWRIPATWAWRRIGDVCTVVGGSTPDTSDPRNFDGGDIPWITPADLSGYREKYISRGQRNITKTGLESSSARLLPRGTVLFSSRAPVGYVAVAERPVATNQGFKSFVPPDGLASDYLYYYLQRAKPLALELASGTTFQEVSGKRAAQIPLAIAPAQEQPRIVAKLEELFSDLDAGIAALERARGNLKRYRAAVLKAAVEGKLTAQWRKAHPDVEPASKLLERILAERRKKWEEAQLAKFAVARKPPPKGWKDKYPEPAKPETDDMPPLPNGWCWAGLAQVATFQNGRAFPSEQYSDEGVKLLRPGNLFADGSVRWEEKNTRRMPERWANEYPEFLVHGSELIMNLTAQSLKDEFLGRICLTSNEDRCLLNQRLARITPIKGLNPRLLLFVLKSHRFRQFVNGLNTGSLIQHMFTTQLEEFAFPLPSVDEQVEIERLIDERLSVCDHSDRILAARRVQSEGLRQAILKRAFEGKLVPQDPNDEPASFLLKRVRAVSAAAQSGNGRAKRAKTRKS